MHSCTNKERRVQIAKDFKLFLLGSFAIILPLSWNAPIPIDPSTVNVGIVGIVSLLAFPFATFWWTAVIAFAIDI